MNNDTQSSVSEKDAAVAVSCGSPSDKAEYLEVEEPQSQEQSNSTCTSETGGLHKCIQNKKIVSKVRPPAHSKSRVMGYRLMPAVVPQSFLVPVHGHGYVPHRDHSEELSSTNLYIRGLAETCRDDDLVELCRQFGKIVSTKAILDKETNLCKGYGFVDFQHATDAQRAVVALSSNGVLAQFAKQQEQDPTNLYMSNLPQDYNEKNIEAMLQTYGNIVSTRVLRDVNGISRGVGFARLDSSESCEKAIMALNGTQLPGANEPLTVKFADGGASRRRASNPGRWKDLVTYSAPECFEMPQVLPNGYYNSRGLVQQYLPSGTHGYQMQQTWPPQYFNVPHGNSSLSLATTAPHAGVTSALPQQQSHYASSATTHTAHYTTQPAGWTISPTTQYIQQHS